jgi:hypothetical protein
MLALLKKMDVLEEVERRLTRLEAGQQEILHARGPEVLQLRKDANGQHALLQVGFPNIRR